MSLTIRYVSDGVNMGKTVAVHERFIKFLPVESTILFNFNFYRGDVLETLELNVQNIRGEGYYNGSNMKCVHSGVQKRRLNISR